MKPTLRNLALPAAALLALLPVGAAAEALFCAQAYAQDFAGAGLPDASGSGSVIPSSASQAAQTQAAQPAGKLCADGTHAIDQGRWADAVAIFTKVIDRHGEHADSALYWKAYAENKLGNDSATKEACGTLRSDYPKSTWIDECGSLEVEINARSGKPVAVDPNASTDVKLLAMSNLLRQNEALALAQIQEILNSQDLTDKQRKEAEFLLGTHYSNVTYAQIVRLRFVDGDVRIQRGKPNSKDGNALWEQAVADLPLETGFSLVTGQGRAEIEFENGSTLFLAENSVLTLNDLHETAGIPYTELGLLAGTASAYFQPSMNGEKLVLHTPASDLITRFPDRSFARVQAFANGVSITQLVGGGVLHMPGVPKDAQQAGRTWTYVQGQLLDPQGSPASAQVDAPAMAAWDKWVADRVTQRDAAIEAVLAQSGLREPIPGMADMAGQGRFFDCAPYGTCWEPNSDSDAAQSAMAQSARPRVQPGSRRALTAGTRALPAHLALASYQPASISAASTLPGSMPVAAIEPGQQAASGVETEEVLPEDRFPCMPDALRYRTMLDGTGRLVRVASLLGPVQPYSWAECHAGTWIRYRHHRHYVWVAGIKRHHIPPVRWVKSGKIVGFVPLHPYDVKGQPAINARHQVFAVSGKGLGSPDSGRFTPLRVESIRLEENMPITYLTDPPKEYAAGLLRPLSMTEAPHMETRVLSVTRIGTMAEIRATSAPIRFDAKTGDFLSAKTIEHGGHTSTSFAPISNRTGSLQARSASFPGTSGSRASVSGAGGSRGGGFSGGSRSSGGSSGGGSHSSSSVSSAGGGHSGGGAVSSGSSSSASSSSGGSHH